MHFFLYRPALRQCIGRSRQQMNKKTKKMNDPPSLLLSLSVSFFFLLLFTAICCRSFHLFDCLAALTMQIEMVMQTLRGNISCCSSVNTVSSPFSISLPYYSIIQPPSCWLIKPPGIVRFEFMIWNTHFCTTWSAVWTWNRLSCLWAAFINRGISVVVAHAYIILHNIYVTLIPFPLA